MKAHWLVIGLLASLAPIAQAQDDPDEALLQVGLDQLSFDNRYPISGPTAANWRQRIDRTIGDGDGTLTTAEVDKWKRNSSGTFTEDKPNCFESFELLRLDGQGPLRVSEVSANAIGLAGPTTSQAPVDYSFHVVFQYRAPANDHPTATMNLHDATFYANGDCYLGYALGFDGEEPLVRNDVVLIHPLGKTRILKDSVAPAQAQGSWDGEGFRFEGYSSVPSQVSFTVERRPPVGFQEIPPWLGYAAAGTGGLLVFGALLTELGRYKLLRLLFLVPGFTRLEKDEVLEHSTREELYSFIKSNQGPSFSDLRRSLELSNGTLVHHLRILEAQGYVKGQREGFRTRFYVRGPRIDQTSYLTRTQQQLLAVIGAHPGLTQSELAELMGLPRQSLFYHTRQLAARGKLEIRADGNRRRYWLSHHTTPTSQGSE